MDFGQAIKALKEGKRVSREGWNGKGMFLILAGGYKVPLEKLREGGPIDGAFLLSRGLEEMDILPHIDMWTVNAHGRQAYLPGWLASQSDMLAEDWSVMP